MALTLHLHRSEHRGSARRVTGVERRAARRAEADLDSVYRDDDYLDDHD